MGTIRSLLLHLPDLEFSKAEAAYSYLESQAEHGPGSTNATGPGTRKVVEEDMKKRKKYGGDPQIREKS